MLAPASAHSASHGSFQSPAPPREDVESHPAWAGFMRHRLGRLPVASLADPPSPSGCAMESRHDHILLE